MFNLCQDEVTYIVSEDVPQSAVELTDDKKADVLIALVNSLRSDHIAWIDRSFTAATWSIGILVTAMSYIALNKATLQINETIFVAIGMALFGLITQLFFCAARNAHHGIGAALSRCEASLGLCESGRYLEGTPFFGYSGKWVPPRQITMLQIFHLFVILLSVLIVVTIKFW